MSDFSAVVDAVVTKVTTQTQELHDMHSTYKARNGSASAVEEWLNNSDDPQVIADREKIAKAMERIKEMKKALEDKARAALVPDGFDTEAFAKEYKEKRNATRTLILQSIGTLDSLGQDTSALEELQDNLPGGLGTTLSASGRSPEEMAKIREWANANGHEVAERGRIKKEILDAYDAENK